MGDSADWFVSNMRYTDPEFSISDEQRRCLNTLAAVTAPSGLYNLPTRCSVMDAFDFFPGGLSVLLGGDMATHDFGQLTNLVLAAHQNYVRVQIGPWNPEHDLERSQAIADELNGYWLESGDEAPYDADSPEVGLGVMEIMMHARHAEHEHRWGVHPGLEQLIAKAQTRLDFFGETPG